jgi:hypothetical protein
MASTFDTDPESHPASPAEPRDRPLTALYEEDEPAWLDAMAQLIAARRYDELDYDHLGEFLADIFRRDRHEVVGRLVQLLIHLLEWDYDDPGRRTRKWLGRILWQQDDLKEELSESRTLRNHARELMIKAYRRAVPLASAETGLDENAFPETCPWTLEEALDRQLEPPTDAD